MIITIHTVDTKVTVMKDHLTLAQTTTRVATLTDTHTPVPLPFLRNLGQAEEAKPYDSPTTEGRDKLT